MSTDIEYNLQKLKDSLEEEGIYTGTTQYLFDELTKDIENPINSTK